MKALKGFAAVGRMVIIFVLLLPGRSLGWGNTWLGVNLEQIINAARGKMGPFRYDAAFRLDNAGYNSDIYFGYLANPVPDYVFSAGPELSLYLPVTKGIVFDISEIPKYTFYLNTNRERAFNNAFRGQVHCALDRLYFEAGGGLRNAKENLSLEFNIPIRHMEMDFGGFAFWQISKGSAIAFQFRSTTFDYEDPQDGSLKLGEILNRRESYLNLTTFLLQVSKTRIYLDAEYGAFDFRETVSKFKDSRSYGIYGGIEFLPESPDKELSNEQNRGIRGRINLGYKYFDVLASRQKEFNGLIGHAGVEANILSFTTIRAVFDRNIQFSVYSDLDYYLQSVYGVGLSYALAKNIQATYDFSFSQFEYVRPAGLDLNGTTSIKYLSHVFGIRLRLGRNLELDLAADLGRRTSNLVGQFYQRHFIGLSLTYGSLGSLALLASPFSR
jgi:hypothetical protein